MSRKIIIYSLSDPRTNEIRYIGKTVQRLELRYRSHISVVKHNRKKDYCHCWIKSLLKVNLKPIINIIEETFDIQREVYWIDFYKQKGCSLTNLTAGGEQGTLGATWKVSKEALEKYKDKGRKPILQFSLSYQFIKEWESGAEFSRFYNLGNGAAVASIINKEVCNGFVLVRKTDYEKDNNIIYLVKQKLNIPILVEDINTGMSIEFENAKILSSYIKSDISGIHKACKVNSILRKRYKVKYKHHG